MSRRSKRFSFKNLVGLSVNEALNILKDVETSAPTLKQKFNGGANG